MPKKTTRKCIWVELSSGRTSTTSAKGYQKFDSYLEYNVWKYLSDRYAVSTQHSITLLENIEGLEKPLAWKCDFMLSFPDTPVEVKGKWINSPMMGTEKKLFILQWALVKKLYPDALLVSDDEWMLGPFKVQKYNKVL